MGIKLITMLFPITTLVLHILTRAQLQGTILPITSHSDGAFTVQLSVGNKPPTDFIFSTENDLTVAPCSKDSRTLRNIPCSSPTCQSFSEKSCDWKSPQCSFTLTYGDGTTDSGSLVKETIRFSTQLSSSVILACGGNHLEAIAGFGGSPLSLPSQLKQTKLSYCLSRGNPGSLRLGWSDESGVKLKLVPDHNKPAFFFVRVNSMMVGKNTIGLTKQKSRMIISTSTTLTTLPDEMYDQLKKAVRKSIKMRPFSEEGLDTCYYVEGNAVPNNFPDVILNSGSEALRVGKENAFGQVGPNKFCLTATKASGDAILGSLWQNNLVVGIDTQLNTVSLRKSNGRCPSF